MEKRIKGVSYAKYGYIFCIPFVLGFSLFMLYPLVHTIVISFSNYEGASRYLSGRFSVLDNPLANYTRLITENRLFWTSLSNTLKIWIINFIPQIVLALVLTAWFTNRRNKIRGKGLFKVLFYMPNIITAGSIAILFSALFSFPIGPVNYLLELIGVREAPINFTISLSASQYIVAFIQFWMWYGYTMLILTSGVLGLNPEIFEVSEIDGANGIQQFFFITLPNLKTILLYMLVTSIVGGLTMFDIPMLFNDGGPDSATTTLSIFIYRQAFSGSFLLNRAAAASMLAFILIAVLSVGVFYLLRDKDAARLKKEEKALRRALEAERRAG
ncbi:MAG: sugar ABC transporter permease [Oscillospiraceae bacterium]|nr:sugar ABC transporter permease [Oscillospiraceae bacterium]